MNKNSSRKSKAKSKTKLMSAIQNSSLSSVHILIAAIAIIECLVLISFTTYSWIESNSSLVIMNGPQSTTTANIVNIDIDDTLNYEIDLDNESGNADLNTFFRFTENYRYGKASSSNGTVFYFPKRNNTYTNASTFRKGDTTDYNTSYTYFDFKIFNNAGNRDFYFYDGTADARDVFTIDPSTASYFEGKTYTDGGQTKNKIDAIRNAMRLSITTKADNVTTTTIYSPTGATYDAQNGLTDSDTVEITTEKIDDYGINKNSTIANANDRKRLFTSKKSSSKKMDVSVRVWFEIMDPDFQKAFNFTRNDQNPNAFSQKDFEAIAGVGIKINLTFANNANNYVPFYFDDYTFDNAAANRGKNMTVANANNSNYYVWFHGFNPELGSSGEFVDYPMERDTSVTSGEYTRWSADSIPQIVTDYLQGGSSSGTISDANLKSCYFAYGTSGSIQKKWDLTDRPGASISEFAYKAYSQTNNGTTTYGAGIWDTPMTLVSFNDMATGITSSPFNNDGTNFRYMSSRGSDYSQYHVFVNNTDAGVNYAGNFTAAVTASTAAMYYDAADQLFKAYVPSTWLNDNGALYFNYSINGYFSQLQTNVRWFARNSVAHEGTYMYTALGYHDNFMLSSLSNQAAYAEGVGTWNDIEKINFSAELIDAKHRSAYRYFVKIGGSFGKTENTAVSYPMVPDATNMVYSAYIPAGLGASATDLSFTRHDGYNNSVSVSTYTNPTKTWAAALREGSSTYYPVSETEGYWNLSVLVDGTYENLIYDTLTDADAMGAANENTGVLQYSVDNGVTWTIIKNQSGTDDNRIDAYRWYVPCESDAEVLYRWTPYYGADKTFGTADDTVFTFTHNTAQGLYCVITESANAMTFNTTPVIRRSAANLAALGLQAQVEPGAAESNDAAAEDTAIEENSNGESSDYDDTFDYSDEMSVYDTTEYDGE